MIMNTVVDKQAEACQVHGVPSHKANWALMSMVFASVSLIIWHVWVYGTTVKAASIPTSFPLQLGSEIWSLLIDSHGILAELRDVFLYFLVGILFAGYMRTYKVAVRLQQSLRNYGFLSVFLASFIGIITPLCACGTVTTAVSLLFAGLPLAPVMSLMITSSLLSPSTYLLTLNDLGPEWTVIRTISAYLMGIFAGIVTHMLRNRGINTETVFIEGAIVRGDFHDEDYPDERLRCNCRQKLGNRVAIRTSNKFLVFLAKSAEMLWPVGKYVLVGVTMGIIVERYVSTNFIYQLFGKKDPLNVVWITLASVPMFLHQLSASSIVGHIKSSLNGTVDGGAALALMIGGPVTAVPTMVMFWSIFKKRVFFLYMFVCLVGTVLISYAFQYTVFVSGADTGNPLLKGVRSISGGSSPTITKQSRNVRIVMDPGGKNIIASYSNDLEGHGFVVFDADGKRFSANALERYDNDRYVTNIADWLEQGNSSSVKEQILVYALSRDSSRARMGMNRSALVGLEQKGFKVVFSDKLTGQQLESSSQVWVLFGDAEADKTLSNKDMELLSRFVGAGKGMLVVAGASSGRNDMTQLNGLASKFGVLFEGSVENGSEIRVSTASHIFSEASDFLGKILKQLHKA
jgi:uncharacterized membrane protein YraQ (UPF0718 family)